MKFRILLLACFVMLGAIPASAQDRMERILANKVLRVGTTMDTPVFSMRNPANGELHGFDMDMLESLSKALGGVKIEYVKMTFGTMLPDLLADKFDVAMSGMGRTLDRARVATFSRPYLLYGKLMIVRKGDKDKYKTLEDLDRPGLKIVHNMGGLNERFAKARFKAATAQGFGSNELALAELVAGRADAQVADSTSAMYLDKNNPQVAAMSPENVFDPVFVAMLVRREDQTLLNFINIWLDHIEMEGEIGKIRRKWLGDYPALVYPGGPNR